MGKARAFRPLDKTTNFLVGFALLMAVLSAFSCPAVQKTVVLRAGDPCLFVPPPTPKQVTFAGPPACPEAFTTCLDARSADTLGDNLSAHQRWENEAWLRCGPLLSDGGR